MSEMNKEGKLRRFYKKHPQFRKGFYFISKIIDYYGLLSWIIIGCFIIAIILAVYFILPKDIKEPVTVVIGGILSALAFPVYIEHNRFKHDSNTMKLEKCGPFHEQMTRLLIDLLNTREQQQQREIARRIIDHIADYYHITCIFCTQKQLDILYIVRDECEMIYNYSGEGRASMDTLNYMAHIYLNDIRKQGFTSGKAFFDDPISQSSEVQK